MTRHPGPRRTLLALAALTASALPLTGCGGEESTTLTVLAASSLTETFTSLADRFEQDHPGVTVTLVFDSSATLAQQAVDGAPGDVLATADLDTMQVAVDGDAVDGDPQVFATNTMVVVTPPGDPAGIGDFAGLDSPGVTYVVCVETAPCGKVAATVLSQAGIDHPPASLEPDVKAVLAKVTAGEADAGLVYRTDAVAAGDQVGTLTIPQAAATPTTYPVAVLQQSDRADLATEFIDLVLGSEGQQVLHEAGFGRP